MTKIRHYMRLTPNALVKMPPLFAVDFERIVMREDLK